MLDNKYFIVAPKGSGKTMYATYFCNNNDITYQNERNTKIKSKIFRIESDIYKKILLLQKKNIESFSFKKIWQMYIIRELVEKLIKNEDLTHRTKNILNALQKECKNLLDFENKSEIIKSSKENTSIDIDASVKLAEVNMSKEFEQNQEFKSIVIDEGLNKKYRTLTDDLSQLMCNKYLYLFIDGIDSYNIPEGIERRFYEECINDLFISVYDLNNILKSKGNKKIKFILLCRDDVYEKINMPNKATKKDNIIDLNYS